MSGSGEMEFTATVPFLLESQVSNIREWDETLSDGSIFHHTVKEYSLMLSTDEGTTWTNFEDYLDSALDLTTSSEDSLFTYSLNYTTN